MNTSKPAHYVRPLNDLDTEAYWQLRLASIYQSAAMSRTELSRELALHARGCWPGVLSLYAQEGGRVWGAFRGGGMLVGVLAVSRYLMRDGVELNLWGLYVHQAHRGSGAAGLLVRSALDWCRRQRARAVTAQVQRCDHRMLGWCRRNGFEAMESRGTRQLLSMRLSLKPGAARRRVGQTTAPVLGCSAA